MLILCIGNGCGPHKNHTYNALKYAYICHCFYAFVNCYYHPPPQQPTNMSNYVDKIRIKVPTQQ